MLKQGIWTEDENAMIRTLLERLAHDGRADDCRIMQRNLTALQHQVDALASYPGIMECTRISNSERNIDTLVAALGKKYPDEDVFVMPSKALLGRCFEISRINLLYMVYHLVCPADTEASTDKERVFCFIMHRMLAVLTEDVLLQILGAPGEIDVKHPAANRLAHIWENRLSTEARSFSPELSSMWLIRRNSIPVFGTLMGTHEYIALYRNADVVCRDYILEATTSAAEAAALEEFLFGLPFEELEIVKKHLLLSKKPCADRDDIVKILGRESIYLSRKTEDPLEIYRFFNYRRKCAMKRRHTQNAGPTCTFEENFMRYLLKKPLDRSGIHAGDL